MASTNLSSVAVNAKLDKTNKIPKISYSYEQEQKKKRPTARVNILHVTCVTLSSHIAYRVIPHSACDKCTVCSPPPET